MFRGTGIEGQAPRLANSTSAPLLDPKVLLEHVSLHKSVSQVDRTASSRNPRGKANSSINNPRSENEKSDKVITHNHSKPNDHQRKGFHSGPEPSRQRETSRELPVGGRLSHFQQAWQKLSDEQWVRSVISTRFKIPFSHPPPITSGSTSATRRSLSSQQHRIIEEEIISLLCKKAIEQVSPSAAGFRSQLFTIPKRTGSRRPVLNLRPLNQFVPKVHFKMESLKSTCMFINQGDFLTSIDLADAFLHVLVDQSSVGYLQFAWEAQLFQFEVLPFGLSLSRLVFTKILRPILRWARRKGIRISAYLDDLLIVAKDYRTSLNQSRLVVRKLSELGFLVKAAKSSLELA
jgi:hypothetical protein